MLSDVNFKTPKVKERFQMFTHKLLKIIAADCEEFLREKYNYILIITESATTWKEDVSLKRESRTHRDRPSRALDFRVIDMPRHVREALKVYLNNKYGQYGAIVKGVPNLIVDKKHGNEDHFHIQIRGGIDEKIFN